MTREELIERLKGFEWKDIEFKEAQFAVPKDVYESVSAFANTEGGHIVFGVSQKGGKFEVVGVISVDDVQNAFLGTLRSGKVSLIVPVQESVIEDEKGHVLVFYIPEASRKEKPVHLDGNFRESFVRKGAGDHHCSEDEVERFIRDRGNQSYDSDRLADLDPETCFDGDVVKWYRRLFSEKQPGRYETHTDMEFLSEWGLVVETRDALLPTRAAILLFGQGKYVRQILPRPVVDYQRIDVPFEEWSPEKRWHDRAPVEDNLVRAWWTLVEKFMQRAERPFSIDVTTLRRDDQPPDYIAFREAAINLLIHQDFGDHRRTPTVKLFYDRSIFWNPGDAFATAGELLDATEKEVRNPSVVGTFRRIGLSDQAGTGMRTIFRNWHELGNVPPVVKNDKADKSFELLLLRQALMSEEQSVLLSTLGAHLSDPEAQTFAYACRRGRIDITDVRAVTGMNPADAREVLQRLEVQALLQALDPEQGIYELKEHLHEHAETLIPEKPQPDAAENAAQVAKKDPAAVPVAGKVLTSLTDTQWEIIRMCDVPLAMSEIMDRLKVTHRGFFKRKHMQTLIDSGLVSLTNPENLTASNQRYVLSPQGVKLNEAHFGGKSDAK